MRLFWKLLPVVIGLSIVLFPEEGWGQENQDPGASSSVGLRVGYGFPQGEWVKSRVAPNVALFSGNLAFEGDFDFRIGQRWVLALGGGYMALRGEKWENYTQSMGDFVRVSASVAHASILLKPHLKTSPPDLISLEIGAVGLFASGEEVIGEDLYTYDFFHSFRLGFQGGLEYDRIISADIAFTVKATAIVVPSGVDYADGVSRTIIYVPVTAGIRFLF